MREKTTKKSKLDFETASTLELETWCIQMRRQGLTIETLQATASRDLSDADRIMEVCKKIKMLCEGFQSHGMVETIIQNDLNKVADRDEHFSVSAKTNRVKIIKPSTLNTLFNPEYLYKKVRHVYDTYEPHTPSVYIDIDGEQHFNMYRPAKWREEYFYNKTSPAPSNVPHLYHEFFMHLVNNDILSYEYLIKWLANSLVTRNYCYLVTIGDMGIGKGLLYQICGGLHGEGNHEQIEGDKFLTTGFNSDLENKTLFYINEIPPVDEKGANRLKVMVEPTIRIEGKGKDAKYVTNHINLMISSNDLSSLPIPKGDRRYSIITLNTVATRDWKQDHDAWVEALVKTPANIAELGRYLLNVKVNANEMIHPFKSAEQVRKIKSTQLLDWEDWFLFQYCKDKAGQTLPIIQIASDVRNGANINLRVSLRTLKKLRDKMPGFFVVRATKLDDGTDGPVGLGFKPLSEQPSRSDMKLEVIENED